MRTRDGGRSPRSRPGSPCSPARAVIAEWAALTIQSYDVGIRGFDSLWYHLPWAASVRADRASITGLRFTDVEYLTAVLSRRPRS